jgi:hypothetical protein
MKSRKSHVKRLGKSLPANQGRARVRRARKGVVRETSRGNTRRALGLERENVEVARLLGALRDEKIRFQLVGMSAALIQGVPGTTNDIDLWIDLPTRQYMRPVNIALGLGAQLVRNTVVELADGTLINFVYEVTGLKKFSLEFKNSKLVNFHGQKIPVLPLESIQKSKRAIMRPKDALHLFYIAQTLELMKRKKASSKGKK